MLDQARIKKLFKYDPDISDKARPLVRIEKTGPRSNIGDRPGFIESRGYVTLCVQGKRQYMHRVVYCFFYGSDFETVDHINRDKSDNRIENLRPATQNENSFNLPIRKNNTSGVSGVNWNKKDQAWHVRIRHSGKRHWVGVFKDKQNAINARNQAVDKYHGEFKGE